MSIRIEQYRALIKARDLMRDLQDRDKTPDVPQIVRHRASRAMRHFPCLGPKGQPIFSPDTFDLEPHEVS